MTVGVISAQKKILRLLTAWEENIPMMEKATEKFLFSVPEVSDGEAGKTQGHKDNCSFFEKDLHTIQHMDLVLGSG